MYRPDDPCCPVCKQPLTSVIVTGEDDTSQLATWRCDTVNCPENTRQGQEKVSKP